MNRLYHWTHKIEQLIKEIDPASIIETTKDTYEGEDAYIRVKTKLKAGYIMDKALPLQGEAMDENFFIVVLPTQIKG